MRVGAHMIDRRVGEQDYAEGAHVFFELLEFGGGEGRVPAEVYEDFDAVVEFEEGLRGVGGGLGAEEWGEGEHFEGLSLSSTHVSCE